MKLIPLLIECIKYNQEEITKIKEQMTHYENIDEEINKMKKKLEQNECEINLIKTQIKK